MFTPFQSTPPLQTRKVDKLPPPITRASDFVIDERTMFPETVNAPGNYLPLQGSLINLTVEPTLRHRVLYGCILGTDDRATLFNVVLRCKLSMWHNSSEVGAWPMQTGYVDPAHTPANFSSIVSVLKWTRGFFVDVTQGQAWNPNTFVPQSLSYNPPDMWWNNDLAHYPSGSIFLHPFSFTATIDRISVGIEQNIGYRNAKLFLACLSYE